VTGGGGTGAAGTTGTDGGATDAGDACTAIEQQYTAAMTQAKQCNPALNGEQCQQSVDSSLPCPGCKTWVDDTQPLDDVRQKWKDAGCDKVHRFCPAIACVNPGKGLCIVKMGGGGGTCSSLTLTPVTPL
jgi:hypothetical protein